MMTPSEIITWSEKQDAAGAKDAMGFPFTSWLLAVKHPGGTMVRDKNGHQVMQTQSQYKTIHTASVGQTMELFA